MTRRTRLNPSVTQLDSLNRVTNWSAADACIDFTTKADGDPPVVLDTGQPVDFLQPTTGYKARILGGKLVPQASLPPSGTYATYYQAQLDGDCRAFGTRWTWNSADGSTDAVMCAATWVGLIRVGTNTPVPRTPAHITITRAGAWNWWVGDGQGPGGTRLKAVKGGTFTPPASDGSAVWEVACYIDSDNGIGYLYLPGVNSVTGSRWVTITDTEINTYFTNAAFLGRSVADGAMTNGSTTLTSATGAFNNTNDAGKAITVAGAGPGGTTLNAYIASVTNSTTAVLSVAASATVSGAAVTLSALSVPSLATALAGAATVFVEHFSSATPQTDRYPKFLSMWGEPLRQQRDIRRSLREKATAPPVPVVVKYDDTRTVADGAMSSVTNTTTLTSATAAFVSGDAGRAIVVKGAGTAGADLSGYIASVTNSTTVVLTVSASTTVSNATVNINQTASPRTVVIGTGASTVYTDPAGTIPATIVAAAGPKGKILFKIPMVSVDFKGSGPKVVTDGAMSSTVNPTVLTSATAAFTAVDKGRRVTVAGAGVGGADLVSIITSYTNSTTVALEDAATTTVSDATTKIDQLETQIFFKISGNPGSALALVRGRAGDSRNQAVAMLIEGLTPNAAYTWTLQVYRVTPGGDGTAAFKFNGHANLFRPPLIIEAQPI